MVAMLAQQALDSYVRDVTLIAVCMGVLSASLFLFAVATTSLELFALTVPIALASTIFGQVNTKIISTASPAGAKGTMMALYMSLFSGVRIVTPILAARMLSAFGFWSVGVCGGIGCLLAVPAILRLYAYPLEDASAPEAGDNGAAVAAANAATVVAADAALSTPGAAARGGVKKAESKSHND
jgi:hypothetical protein